MVSRRVKSGLCLAHRGGDVKKGKLLRLCEISYLFFIGRFTCLEVLFGKLALILVLRHLCLKHLNLNCTSRLEREGGDDLFRTAPL